MSRLRVGVVFGGRSGEHEVSVRSAKFVLDSLDPEKYDVVPIGIDKRGEWLMSDDPMPLLTGGERHAVGNSSVPVQLPTGSLKRSEAAASFGRLDVVFPVLHGPYGEDGTVQGLLELAGIPYVGAGVTGSAVCMDKALMKSVLRDHDLPVAPWVAFTRHAWRADSAEVRAAIDARLGYPVFVKPSNLGSSVGISKAHEPAELDAAVMEASQYDRRLIVEQAVPRAREIEVSVLGNERPEASLCGEIIPGNEFYDYDAKYLNPTTRDVIPADLPVATAERIRELAVQTFRALDAAGFARVDFLLDGATLEVFVNEINTIPGFTAISMFPKLWEASGLGNRALLDRLIELALERHGERQALRSSYT